MCHQERKGPNAVKLHMRAHTHTHSIALDAHLSRSHILSVHLMSDLWTHTSARTGCLDTTLI